MKELIKKLYDNPNEFNYEAVKEIRKNKGEINSYLLEELDKNIKNLNINKGLPIFADYALFLLAEFKEKKAFPLILELLSIPNLDGYDVLGDGIMERLSSIIVSVFNGDFEELNKIIQNKDIDYYIRNNVIETYIYFYNNNFINKNDLIEFLRKVIILYEYNDEIYNSILTVIINAHLNEMIPDVKKMFDNKAIDYYIRGGYPEFIDYLFDYNDNLDNVDVITNIEDNMAWWYCFNQNKDDEESDYEELSQSLKKYVEEDIKQNVVDYSKIGRNDPCPCGSGKKYKKCCLNSVENSLPYQNYINRSLENYPKKNSGEKLDFYSLYDEEYIKIDKLLYKALKRKNIPLFIERNIAKEKDIDFTYLDEAYPLIKGIVKNKKIKSIDEYDESVSIHFSLYSFFKYYTDLIIEKIDKGRKDYIEKLEEVINYFYTTFELDEQWEFVFLEKINSYYLITKKYKEAIKFFESKLSNKYAKYDVYDYLFNLYSIAYEYDKYIKKMDDLIDNEPDKELKEELINMKIDYVDDEEYEYN